MWQCHKTTSPCSPVCPRTWAAPASSPIQLPISPLSLDHSSLSLLQHYCTAELDRGGMLDDMSHVNMLRGGGGSLSAHTPAHCHTVHFSVWSSCFLTSSHTHPQRCTHSDPLWWLWQPFVRSKRFLSKQNQSPPPSSAAESSGARSVPASLFKSGLKRRADLHSTFTFEKNWAETWWTCA